MFLFPLPKKRTRGFRVQYASDYTEVAGGRAPLLPDPSRPLEPYSDPGREGTGESQVGRKRVGRAAEKKRVLAMNESCLSHTTCSFRGCNPDQPARSPARAARDSGPTRPRSRPSRSSLRSRRVKGCRVEAGESGPSPEPRPPKPRGALHAGRDRRARPACPHHQGGVPAGWLGARRPASE